MEAIIREIIEKLAIRQTKKLSLIYKKDEFLDQRLFLEAQTICIQRVNVLALTRLSQFDDSSPWVEWIIEGLSYGVEFKLQLATEANHLIPFELLTDWPMAIYDKDGFLLTGFSTKAITYQQVARLDESMKLLLNDRQWLTSLARETLLARKIDCLERTG